MRSRNRSAIPSEFQSPDGSLSLRFQRGSPSVYTLSEISSGRLVATAISAIELHDFQGSIFRGTVDVIYTPDSSAVCIEEDVSDALPAVRYILIRREQNCFRVSYLFPKSHRWGKGTLDYELAEVVGLTHHSITLRYPFSKRIRKVNLRTIETSDRPETRI